MVVLQHQTTLYNTKQQIGLIVFQNVTLLFICILDISYFAFYWRSLKHRGLRTIRKIYDQLTEWKGKYSDKHALLVEGARRIGKSTVRKRFAEENYKSYIIIDFAKANKKTKDNFDNLDNLDIFFQNLSLLYNTRLYRNESLIIFDEVQKFPRAREAIKYLVMMVDIIYRNWFFNINQRKH